MKETAVSRGKQLHWKSWGVLFFAVAILFLLSSCAAEDQPVESGAEAAGAIKAAETKEAPLDAPASTAVAAPSPSQNKGVYQIGYEMAKCASEYYFDETKGESALAFLTEKAEAAKKEYGADSDISRIADGILAAFESDYYGTASEYFFINCLTVLRNYFLYQSEDEFNGLRFLKDRVIFVDPITSDMAAVCDLDTGLRGIYDTRSGRFVIEPTSYYVAECGEGLYCVEKEGYYGCIDGSGVKTVGFYYEEPIEFQSNGFAVVRSNELYGVINAVGKEILPTKYVEIIFKLAPATKETYFAASQLFDYKELFGLYDPEGKALLAHRYDRFILDREYIYAAVADDYGYELYDYGGFCLVGDDSGNQAYRIWRPESNGLSVVEYKFDSNQKEYWTYDPVYNYDYMYVGENFEPINRVMFTYTSDFNELGLAFISLRKYEKDYNWVWDKTYIVSDKAGYAIMRSDGSIYRVLPYGPPYYSIGTYTNEYNYQGVNEYYLYLSRYGNAMLGTEPHYYLVDLESTEMTEWDEIQMIDGTNCIVLADSESGLYGLLDGYEFALDFLYNSISYDERSGQIIAKRGAEPISYTPSAFRDPELEPDLIYLIPEAICPDEYLYDRSILGGHPAVFDQDQVSSGVLTILVERLRIRKNPVPTGTSSHFPRRATGSAYIAFTLRTDTHGMRSDGINGSPTRMGNTRPTIPK